MLSLFATRRTGARSTDREKNLSRTLKTKEDSAHDVTGERELINRVQKSAVTTALPLTTMKHLKLHIRYCAQSSQVDKRDTIYTYMYI